MQLGGIGSGHDANMQNIINHNPSMRTEVDFHDKSMHHITKCIRRHGASHLESGMKTGGAGGNMSSALATGRQSQTGFSLAQWLADPLGSTKKLLGVVWKGGSESGNGIKEVSGQALDGKEQALARIAEAEAGKGMGLHNSMNDSAHGQPDSQMTAGNPANVPHTPQAAAAATGVQQPASLQGSPYFSAVEKAEKQQNLLQKVKMRFQSAADFLAKKFPFSGRFSGKNPFQAKQEKPKEDLRKRSHYREDDLEIECVLTDDSYLLDSYDRRGEYSQLSTRK